VRGAAEVTSEVPQLSPKAIVILANTGKTDATAVLNVNVTQLGLKGSVSAWDVQDLWADNAPVKRMDEAQLTKLSVLVTGDLKPRGGLAVLKITPAA
jgi:hypothetical protein